MEQNQTVNDILEIVTFIKDNAITREEFTELREEVTGLKQDVTGLKQDVTGLTQDMTMVRATMVTKDYLDEKMADLRGDLVVLMRKEDHKLQELVQILRVKNILTQEEMKHLFKLEPFQQII